MGNEIERGQLLTPSVTSVANPSADLLLQLRHYIQHSPEAQGLFLQLRQGKSVAWLRDMLATQVATLSLGEFSFEEVVQGCLYLADEYNQLGEGYFIVSTETGRTISVVTEDDLYDPGLQARHSGSMAPALKRLKPARETMLVTYHHEKAREENVLATLTERAHQTALLKEEGDPRLRLATRGGRKAIAQDLSEDKPWELLQRSGGTSGMFLRHFPLAEKPPSLEGTTLIEGTAVFRSTLKVQDALTLNLSYNRLGTLRSAAPQGWVRDIARQLSETVYKERRPLPVDAEDVIVAELSDVDLWVADADTYKHFLSILPTIKAVPVEGVSPLGLKDIMGCLCVAETFQVESHELFQRWEIVASLEYKLYVFDLKSLFLLPVVGVPREGLVGH